MFRHTHATDLLCAGCDAAYVQKRLGPAQIQTTANTYAHLTSEDMGEAFARYQKERARWPQTRWNRTVQIQLLSQLQGFWADDLWDMHDSPAGTLSPNTHQRWLRFSCKSAAINGELKSVCWKKFSDGAWRSTQELAKVHLLIRWLNSMPELPVSLLCRSFPEWQALYLRYLIERGMYKPGTTNRMNGKQEPSITQRDSPYMSLLRQALIVLADAYDMRPAHGKDIWDLKQMGVGTNLSQSNVKLSFLMISASVVRLLHDLRFLACVRQRFSVRQTNFNLTKRFRFALLHASSLVLSDAPLFSVLSLLKRHKENLAFPVAGAHCGQKEGTSSSRSFSVRSVRAARSVLS